MSRRLALALLAALAAGGALGQAPPGQRTPAPTPTRRPPIPTAIPQATATPAGPTATPQAGSTPVPTVRPTDVPVSSTCLYRYVPRTGPNGASAFVHYRVGRTCVDQVAPDLAGFGPAAISMSVAGGPFKHLNGSPGCWTFDDGTAADLSATAATGPVDVVFRFVSGGREARAGLRFLPATDIPDAELWRVPAAPASRQHLFDHPVPGAVWALFRP